VVTEHEVIKKLASGLRNLMIIVDKYELPPVGSLDYIMPLKPILMRIAKDLLDVGREEETIKHTRPQYWFEKKWLRSTIETIRSSIIFIHEVRDILEVEREALDMLDEMLKSGALAGFMAPGILEDTRYHLKHFIEVISSDREGKKEH